MVEWCFTTYLVGVGCKLAKLFFRTCDQKSQNPELSVLVVEKNGPGFKNFDGLRGRGRMWV